MALAGRHGNAVRADRRGDGDRSPPCQHGLGRVEDHAEPAAAGVDHAGVAQHRQLLRGVRQGLAGGGRCLGEHVAGPRPGLGGTRLGRLRRGSHHGEDGALDGRAHGGVRTVRRLAQSPRHDAGVALLGRRGGDGGGQGAEHLAEDHPAVAARPQQRALAEGGEPGEEITVVPVTFSSGLAQRVAGGGHGEVHVGAGVAVGHGVDVERVDLLARLGERVDRDVDEAEHHRQLDRAAAAGHLLHLVKVRAVPRRSGRT